MEYFELPYRLNQKERWLLYFTNDHDGVATDKDGTVLTFASKDSLAAYAKKKRWKLKPATQDLDFDRVRQWVEKIDGTKPDCPALYATWNLMGDIASSLGQAGRFPGYDNKYEPIHEELFWGCNLPGMAPADRPYQPRFTKEEVKSLQEVLAYGLELFLSHKKDLPE